MTTKADAFKALVGEAVSRHAPDFLTFQRVHEELNDQEYYQTAKKQFMRGATERVISQLLDRAVADVLEESNQ